MRFVLRRKLGSLAGAFTITDDGGGDCFYVHGKLFSLGDKLSFQDAGGRELAFIHQDLDGPTRPPHYSIYRGGQLAATVRQLSHVRQQFEVQTTPDGPAMSVGGDLLGAEYAFTEDGRTVASVSTRWALGGGSYGVDVADGEDVVLVLSVVVAIEMINHHKEG